MVFQSYALYPHMSVRDNLAFGLKLRKVAEGRDRARVKRRPAILQLEKLLDRKPKELSGGQRQRVALGRAIVREPAVFLMDEPLSNLDAKLRVQTRAEIARLHQRLETTMVYVTHDQVEAMTMGQRIAVMSEGLLQQVGTPQTLYDTPINRFVAGFIGSPSMNFVEVHVDAPATGARARRTGRLVDPAARPASARRRGRRPARRSSSASGRSTSSSARSPSGDRDHSRARADVVEYLGNEELLHVNAGGRTSSRSSDSRAPGPPGRRRDQLVLPLDKLHLFDAETGLTLGPEREAAPRPVAALTGRSDHEPAPTRRPAARPGVP